MRCPCKECVLQFIDKNNDVCEKCKLRCKYDKYIQDYFEAAKAIDYSTIYPLMLPCTEMNRMYH